MLKMWMFTVKWMMLFLIVAVSVNAAKNTHQDTLLVEKSEELVKQLEECKQSFVAYKNYFLKGVKDDFFVTYNKTTEEECLQLCCLEKHFECHSFSYYSALKLCYVMNLTKHDDLTQLTPVVGIIHYDVPAPTDSTPSIIDTTAGETTASFTSSTPSEEIARITSFDSRESESTTSIFEQTAKSRVTSETLKSTSSKISAATENGFTSSSNDVTSPSLAKAEAATDAPFRKPVVVFNIDQTSKSTEDATALSSERSSSEATCSPICQNGGTCLLKSEQIEDKQEVECVCTSGYYGDYCEKKTSTQSQGGDNGKNEKSSATGVPVYAIIVAVFGFILVCLFVTLLVLYIIYRKKTGKYRVKEQRERWNKRTRKAEARRSKSFLSSVPRSPIGSEWSVPGSLNSSGTHSTMTSV